MAEQQVDQVFAQQNGRGGVEKNPPPDGRKTKGVWNEMSPQVSGGCQRKRAEKPYGTNRSISRHS